MSHFDEPLTKNKLPLFYRKAKPYQSSAKCKINIVKERCQLFSRLLFHVEAECDMQAFSSMKIKSTHRHVKSTLILKQLEIIMTMSPSCISKFLKSETKVTNKNVSTSGMEHQNYRLEGNKNI